MAVIFGFDGRIFRPYSYEKESDFEADVVRLADQLFGAGSLYVNVKKRMGNDIITIPDGYLIDTTEPEAPELFVIENEIVGHDPFKHIGIQMLRFVTSFEESQRALRTFLMKEINANVGLMARLEAARRKSRSPNIDEYLDRAVYRDFRGLVVIDEARPELHRVLEKINANISVLELKAFIADDGVRIHEFDTLYDEFDDEPEAEMRQAAPSQPEERVARRERRAASDTIVVPARDDGFHQVFLKENQWFAVRIGAAMKERLKYVAAYRVAPVSAITHMAEIKEIKPYRDTGKYQILFKGPPEEIGPIPLGNSKPPQSPIYVQSGKLRSVKSLAEAMQRNDGSKPWM